MCYLYVIYYVLYILLNIHTGSFVLSSLYCMCEHWKEIAILSKSAI